MYELKVYYEDTDAGEVVYYASYLRFLERARTEYMIEKGLDVENLIQQGIFFVVVHIDLNFIAPAKLYDILQIETKTLDVKYASFTFENSIKRKSDNKIILKGKTKLACINNDYKPIKIPEPLVEKLKNHSLELSNHKM